MSKTQYGLSVFYIRGIGFNDTALGASPAVSVYTDQFPIPYARWHEGDAGLERVEVLKGPQGTLFGQNSTGGAINFIAAKPTDALQAGADLTYGRFNEADARLRQRSDFRHPVRRLAVRNEYRDDWQKGYTDNETLGEKNFRNTRLIIDWRPIQKVEAQLLATGWKDDLSRNSRNSACSPPRGMSRPSLSHPDISSSAAERAQRGVGPGRDYRQNNWFYQLGGRVDVALTDAISSPP